MEAGWGMGVRPSVMGDHQSLLVTVAFSSSSLTPVFALFFCLTDPLLFSTVAFLWKVESDHMSEGCFCSQLLINSTPCPNNSGTCWYVYMWSLWGSCSGLGPRISISEQRLQPESFVSVLNVLPKKINMHFDHMQFYACVGLWIVKAINCNCQTEVIERLNSHFLNK